MSLARRSLLRLMLAAPVVPALAPSRAAAGHPVFRPPDEAARRAALGPLDDLAPALRAAFTPTTDDRPIPDPGPDDWLGLHVEPGQSFADFKRERLNRPTKARDKIYVLPIGPLTGDGMPDLDVLLDFTGRYFQLPTVRLEPTTMRDLRARSRSRRTYRQFYTRDILASLRARVPADAYCLIAVTADDLYPHPDWNFVFGEATLVERVGVYGFARYDPAFYGEPRGLDAPAKILLRGLKVLAHEVGHMFGIQHCIHFHCVMNGCNHLAESDASPLHPCPVCLRKLHHAVGFDPAARERRLGEFFRARGLLVDAARGERRHALISAAR